MSEAYRIRGSITSDFALTQDQIESLELAVRTIIMDQGEHLGATIYIEEAE